MYYSTQIDEMPMNGKFGIQRPVSCLLTRLQSRIFFREKGMSLAREDQT